MKTLSAAVFGVIFGLGLLISGMLDPAKVLGFLDVAGAWNPQLAFVMGGAIAVAFPAFLIARRRDGGGVLGGRCGHRAGRATPWASRGDPLHRL